MTLLPWGMGRSYMSALGVECGRLGHGGADRVAPPLSPSTGDAAMSHEHLSASLAGAVWTRRRKPSPRVRVTSSSPVP